MQKKSSWRNTYFYIHTHWPGYLFGYGGLSFLALLLILYGSNEESLLIVTVGFALLIGLMGALSANLLILRKLDDRHTIHPEDVLFEMGRFELNSKFVHIDLGDHHTAIRLASKLSVGQITVIDIYNPQLTPSPTLVRARRLRRKPASDRRLLWKDGAVDLLPAPDQSINSVTLDRVATQLWQHGDREILFKEIFRLLEPDGRFLIIERIYNRKQIWLRGPAAFRLPAPAYWKTLLQNAGFIISKELILNDLYYCVRADKPGIDSGEQLRLEF